MCREDRSQIGQAESPGFTLVELLIVIVILGLLATVVVFSVGGITDRGQHGTCVTDERTLVTAVEAYFGQNETSTIPSGGAGLDQFEMTLVNARYIRSVSSNWTVAADGALSPQDPAC